MEGVTYFLIVSLRRCGSTHLAFLLNQAENVFCDRELVVRDAEHLQSNHIAITGEDFSFRRAIDAISPGVGFCGSKVTLPEYQQAEADAIVQAISGEPIRVIHLTRNLAHQMISLKAVKHTKVWHVLNEDHLSGAPEWSRDAEEYISSRVHTPLSEPLFQLDKKEVEQFCENAIAVDRALGGLAKSNPYLCIDHDNIDGKMSNIFDFIGAPRDETNVNAGGLTNRVIQVPHEQLVKNWSEVEAVFTAWENRQTEFQENITP